jgi:hypothetical protein
MSTQGRKEDDSSYCQFSNAGDIGKLVAPSIRIIPERNRERLSEILRSRTCIRVVFGFP